MLPTPLVRAFGFLGLAFLASVVWIAVDEGHSEWRGWQSAFAELAVAAADVSDAAPVATGIRQIWLPDLRRVDRCTTCHLGSDDPAFAAAAQPFRTHSGDWLESHPPNRFGCTTCHSGQGFATTYRGAAHEPIPHWSESIRSGELVEASCGVCHRGRRPPQAAWLARGRELMVESNCAGCHEIPGLDEADVRAPRIDSLGYKLQPGWLRGWLEDPEAYLPDSRMPTFRLERDEIEDLAAFLLEQRAVEPVDSSTIDWTRADPERGSTLFRQHRCVTCHALDGRGGGVGPELTRVGSKARREWLFSYLQDPFRHQAETLMPHFRFADSEVRDLVAYLKDELVDLDPRSRGGSQLPDPARVDAGRDVFVRRGCHGCHRLSGLEDAAKIGPKLDGVGARRVDDERLIERGVVNDLPNWLFAKLRGPETLIDDSRMPTFGFSEEDAAALTLALLSLRDGELPVSRVIDAPTPARLDPQGEFGALVRRYRCFSCHEFRGQGGALSTVALDRIGSQLRREHLESYLKRPYAIRVGIEQRMPRLNMTDSETRLIADHLARVFVDDDLERAVPSTTAAIAQGRELYERLGCQGCHIVGGRGGYVGPDLSNCAQRLKPGWTVAWLLEPERWKPATLHPDYGLEHEQVESLTAYLMTLSTDGGAGE